MFKIQDAFNARALIKTPHGDYVIYRLDSLEKAGLTHLEQLPFSIRILLRERVHISRCHQSSRVAGKSIQTFLRPFCPCSGRSTGFHRCAHSC
jgi:hypothetical protein